MRKELGAADVRKNGAANVRKIGRQMSQNMGRQMSERQVYQDPNSILTDNANMVFWGNVAISKMESVSSQGKLPLGKVSEKKSGKSLAFCQTPLGPPRFGIFSEQKI